MMAPHIPRTLDEAMFASCAVPIVPKKRRKISNEQRKALRDYQQNSNPTPSYKELILWFSLKYDGHVIGISTVGECLSIKFDHLGTKNNKYNIKRHRDEGEKWPDLEDALWEWTQRYLAAQSR